MPDADTAMVGAGGYCTKKGLVIGINAEPGGHNLVPMPRWGTEQTWDFTYVGASKLGRSASI